MSFPFTWAGREMGPEDLVRLEGPLFRTFADWLPCTAVHCFGRFADGELAPDYPAEWEPDLRRTMKKQRPRTTEHGARLFLPILNGAEVVGVAVLEGREPGVFFEYPHAQLIEMSRRISRELALLKDWSIDPVTGLLNGKCFHEELAYLVTERDAAPAPSFILVLLEVYPKARHADHGLHYIAKAAAYLDSLVGQYSPLYHFGAGVFAMLWREADLTEGGRMAEAVLRWLKREDFGPVHVGITCRDPEAPELPAAVAGPGLAGQLLDQAWQALGTARQRGSYGVCSYVDLMSRERLRLSTVAPEVLDALRQRWRGVSRFSLALVQRDGDAAAAAGAMPDDRWLDLIAAGADRELPVLPDGREAYVFLAGYGADEARQWASAFQARVRVADRATYSVGIATCPLPGGKKDDMVLNARKALVHGAFFGPASLVVFDAVSCNISGDVFYNTGDLSGAVEEYRRGLLLDSTNINILNSLGVAYAGLNRNRQAVRAFEAVLRVAPADFMALFNLGFAYLAQGESDRATDCFVRALAVEPEQTDLLIQLGRLYCRANRHAAALPLLLRAEKLLGPEDGKVVLGVVQRYLGEVFMVQDRHREAMAHFERATALNPLDAEAMGRLGEIYAREKQGDDIALSLCRQAVELEGDNWEGWLRLGRVQNLVGDAAGAVESLRRGLRLNRKSVEMVLQLARAYMACGQAGRARKMYAKVLRLDPTHVEAGRALRE